MSPDGYVRAKELFLAACELPAAERSSFLGEECQGDEGLRLVTAYVALFEEVDDAGFFQQPVHEVEVRFAVLGAVLLGGVAALVDEKLVLEVPFLEDG